MDRTSELLFVGLLSVLGYVGATHLVLGEPIEPAPLVAFALAFVVVGFVLWPRESVTRPWDEE